MADEKRSGLATPSSGVLTTKAAGQRERVIQPLTVVLGLARHTRFLQREIDVDSFDQFVGVHSWRACPPHSCSRHPEVIVPLSDKLTHDIFYTQFVRLRRNTGAQWLAQDDYNAKDVCVLPLL